MKKILFTLATVSTIILSISGCNTPNNSSSSPTPSPSSGISPSPTTAPTGTNAAGSKASVIAVYNCVKAKSPELAAAMDSYIAVVNASTDANWARDAADIQASLKRFETYGCKL